jgi:hypothetical protein
MIAAFKPASLKFSLRKLSSLLSVVASWYKLAVAFFCFSVMIMLLSKLLT